MKRLAIIAVVLVVLVSHAVAQQNPNCKWVPGRGWMCPIEDRTAPGQTPAEEIVRIIIDNGNNTEDRGSGVLVEGPDDAFGWVLTADHVTEQRDALVVFPDGRKYQGRHVRSDRQDDLALLKIAKPHVSPRKIADGQPPQGSEVALAGYPNGIYQAWATSRRNVYDNGAKVEVTGEAGHGSSGGPMINQRGRVVSIIATSQRVGRGQWTTSGCLTARLRHILRPFKRPKPQQPTTAPQTAPPQPTIDPPELAGPPTVDPDQFTPPDKNAPDESPSKTRRVARWLGIKVLERMGFASDAAQLFAIITGTGGVGAVLWWFLKRRGKKRIGEAIDRHREAGKHAPEVFRHNRQNEEIAELLRLSTLEGRDPLHDAIVGRFAYDELDAHIENGDKPIQPSQFKNRLESRFNSVAPLDQTVSVFERA